MAEPDETVPAELSDSLIREESATVQLRVRMKEPLRAALEQEAARHGVSMNTEIVHRLSRSFYLEQHLREATNDIDEGKGVLRRLLDVFEEVVDTMRAESQSPVGEFQKVKRQVRHALQPREADENQ
jgi:Arc-like DNA binding domain